MATTTIRVREPRELLALLPYQLGFRPERSAVAVALRPPRGRVGLVARVDLADLAEPDLGPGLARRLVTHLVGDGAGRAVLVVYAPHDPRPWVPCAPGPDGAGVVRAVRHFRDAAAGFLGDVAVWVVGPDGYLSLDCADPGCCPPGGRPLRELESTEVGAHMVLAGAMVADSRDGLVPDVPAPAGARRNAVRAARRSSARRAAAAAAHPDALAAWRADGLREWRTQLAATRSGAPAPAAARTGRLVAALADVAVRDAVLLTLVAGAGDLAERSLAAGAAGTATAADAAIGREVAAALAAVVSPDGGVPPDAGTLAAAGAVLERVAAHARGPERAPALALLGLLAWWRGDGARSAVLLERALGCDPGHRLARLLAEAVAAGLAPGWARAPR